VTETLGREGNHVGGNPWTRLPKVSDGFALAVSRPIRG
jgi:hypothetical protein